MGDRKRESRKRQRAREKEDLFVADYIKYKYQDMYHEAQHVYQLLLKNYPNKHDMRKAFEHKAWKKMKPSVVHPALNIIQEPVTEPATTISEPSITEPATTTSEPLITEPATTTTTSDLSTSEPTTTPETMYSDNLRLIIPLMKTPIKHPDPISETLTEETLQEEGGEQQQHLNCEMIDPEIMEQIISELRSDPSLKDLFADVEAQFQQEIGLDIDIDINMDTGLEDELANWGVW